MTESKIDFSAMQQLYEECLVADDDPITDYEIDENGVANLFRASGAWAGMCAPSALNFLFRRDSPRPFWR